MEIYERHKPMLRCPHCGTVFTYTYEDCMYTAGHKGSRRYLRCPSCGFTIFPSMMDCSVVKRKPGLLERFFGKKVKRTVIVKARVCGKDISIGIPGGIWNAIGTGSKEWNDLYAVSEGFPSDCGSMLVRSVRNGSKVTVDLRDSVQSVLDWAAEAKFSESHPVKELTKAIAAKYNGRCFADTEIRNRMEVFRFAEVPDGLIVKIAGCGSGIWYDENHSDSFGDTCELGDEGWCLPYINRIETGDPTVSEIGGREFDSMLKDIKSLSAEAVSITGKIRDAMSKYGVYCKCTDKNDKR